MVTGRAGRAWVLVSLFGLAPSASAEPADRGRTLFVVSKGPDWQRVEVSTPRRSNRRGPLCNLDVDLVLWDRLDPGQTLSASLTGDCFCIRHTYGEFRNVGWSAPQLSCPGRGGSGSDPVWVFLHSDRP